MDNESKITDGTYDESYDCLSFSKWLVAWELLGNNDGAGSNMYLVKKNNNSKICMGPMWDFDQALIKNEGWIRVHEDLFYFDKMFKSSNNSFENAFNSLWKSCGKTLCKGLIDKLEEFRLSPEAYDYQNSLDIEKQYGINQDWWQPYVGDLEFMCEYAAVFLSNREEWIDSMIPEDWQDSVKSVECTDLNSRNFFYDIYGRTVLKNSKGIQIRARRKVLVH